MRRRLIIDGNAVYELDEECMLRQRKDQEEKRQREERDRQENRKE